MSISDIAWPSKSSRLGVCVLSDINDTTVFNDEHYGFYVFVAFMFYNSVTINVS